MTDRSNSGPNRQRRWATLSSVRTGDAHEASGDRALVAVVATGLALIALAIPLLNPARALACANPVACENALPGDPASDWQVQGAGDATIQGYATSFSVNVGQTVSFKISTPSPKYHIDILRLGYYGGDGARLIQADIKPTATLPQTQPACLTSSSTGLVDCGNWSVSASWTVPSTAVSGVYVAHLVRDDSQDPGGDSQIPFVVRNDASHSQILLSTSDATWEAYNDYGGNSLYTCTVACPPGNPLAYKAAYAVSYNRPFDGAFATDGGASYLYYAEYQMIYWLEEQGYDVSYVGSADVAQNINLLLNHKLFISSGHDEYWSADQLANVKAALNAGVNLAFFSGNEIFWKTRWGPSLDDSNTPYRTLITYKETHFNAPVDPADPPTWTGAWADPRFSPPADGGRPANALTGQEFLINSGTADLTIPSQYSNLRLWRNTRVAKLTSGQSLTLAPGTGTLGYEWDVDADNGFRPTGLFDASSTTVSGVQPFLDYGSTVGTGTVTHHLTLYRVPSGALVFGAGTVQWSWGLADVNAWHATGTDPSGNPPDPTMEQATVNLFADMGVQPTTLSSELTAAAASVDTTPPRSTITAPAAGASLADGDHVTVSGSATDSGGGVVAGVEISTDGGSTWHPTNLSGPDATTVGWSYSWLAHGMPATALETRAVDDSGNVETPADATSVHVTCPCSMWGTNVAPAQVDSGDPQPVVVGVKFTSDTYGQISALRFYKASANTGTHVGSLWSADGTLLASATFTNETASGWQTVTLSNPIPIVPHTTYVAGYLAPNGHYSATANWFYPSPAPTPVGGATIDAPPLHAMAAASGANGVYSYSATNTFPSNSYAATNYWVDVVFSPLPAPGTVTNVSATAGRGSATVTWSPPSTGGTPTSYVVTPYLGSQAQSPTTVTGTPPATSVTINGLTSDVAYTFTVQAVNPNGSGPTSAPSAPVTPTPLTPPTAPTQVSAAPASAEAQVTWTAPADNGGSPITGYVITPYVGSAAQTPFKVSSPSATSTTVTGLTNGATYTFTVAAINGIGSSPASNASGAVTPNDTIFDFTTPTVLNSGDPNGVELGVKFTADKDGEILGIRFYKAPGNTGAHAVHLWTAAGQLLAGAYATNETASGWQNISFSSPIVITAGTTYVASYYAPNGDYSVTPNGLGTGIDNPPLHAVGNNVSADGVYAYGPNATFPNSTFNASSYGVDVMYAVAAAPGQVTGVTAAGGQTSANISWSAPTSGGPATSYTITPIAGGVPQTPTVVTGTPAATAATVNDLTAGTSYSFTVQASNTRGAGPVSESSNAVTPTMLGTPGAPRNVQAVPASRQAIVNWSAPNSGGSSITGYTITPYIGSSAQTPTQVINPSATSAPVTGLTNGTSYTFTVAAINSAGTGAPSAASNAVVPEDTIFDGSAPATAATDSGDSLSVNLGVEFNSSTSGRVLGIRFYKAAANTGTHIGALWSSTGTLLASGTFTDETAFGWQTLLFSSPVPIAAGTTYIASYLAPNGHYSATGNGLAASVDNAPLHAISNGSAANGVYAYGPVSAFPNSTFNATNYWVDVLFATP